MKSISLGKYTMLIKEYSKIPKEEHYKIPAGLNMDYGLLFSLLIGSGESEYELAHLVLTDDESEPGSYEVQSLTNIAALYACLTMILSSKGKRVKLHKERFILSLKAKLRTYWTVDEDIDYWYVSLRDKPDIKAVVADIDELLGQYEETGIIQLVVGSKTYEAPATIETIEWFSDSLIDQERIGYVLMDTSLANYGELMEFILGYEHACVEVARATGEIRVWVVLAGPFLIGQTFPRENRRYTAWVR